MGWLAGTVTTFMPVSADVGEGAGAEEGEAVETPAAVAAACAGWKFARPSGETEDGAAEAEGDAEAAGAAVGAAAGAVVGAAEEAGAGGAEDEEGAGGAGPAPPADT